MVEIDFGVGNVESGLTYFESESSFYSACADIGRRGRQRCSKLTLTSPSRGITSFTKLKNYVNKNKVIAKKKILTYNPLMCVSDRTIYE